MKKILPFVIPLFLSTYGCGNGNDTPEDRLASRCVINVLGLERFLGDGAECSNFGYGDCPDAFASECNNYCAFDICQPHQCLSEADCTWLGSAYECKEYIVGACCPNPSTRKLTCSMMASR